MRLVISISNSSLLSWLIKASKKEQFMSWHRSAIKEVND